LGVAVGSGAVVGAVVGWAVLVGLGTEVEVEVGV
jgi:uncharacterized membrane protein (Fun14 family)